MDIEKAYNLCAQKIKRNIEVMPEFMEYFATWDGKYFDSSMKKQNNFMNMYNWTTSFYTGMAILAFYTSKDMSILNWLNSKYNLYYQKVFEHPMETMHDLGFLYSLYSVALYKLTGDINQKKVALKAADELAKRFVIKGGYINAWAKMDDMQMLKEKPFAIIDCMMNLPLLFWASEETGNKYYSDIAETHADTTLKYFIREDCSVCHAFRFDPQSGEPQGEENYCGFDKNSHWARGTSWAIYGFAIAYSYTKKQEYLIAAVKLAEKFISICEDDGIPVWDFKLPKDKPAIYCGEKQEYMNWDITDPINKKFNRDTSAAAITVCGIHEISKHTKCYALSNAADKIMNNLIEKYTNSSLDVNGILKCQNGNMTYTIFGDYFFMEGLYRKMYGDLRIW